MVVESIHRHSRASIAVNIAFLSLGDEWMNMAGGGRIPVDEHPDQGEPLVAGLIHGTIVGRGESVRRESGVFCPRPAFKNSTAIPNTRQHFHNFSARP
jgi:hypothetical protein